LKGYFHKFSSDQSKIGPSDSGRSLVPVTLDHRQFFLECESRTIELLIRLEFLPKFLLRSSDRIHVLGFFSVFKLAIDLTAYTSSMQDGALALIPLILE
jgi:hypothetical protein